MSDQNQHKNEFVFKKYNQIFTARLRTSRMGAKGCISLPESPPYRDSDCGGERVLVKALPVTWWEIPARPQHLHGSAET